jgi:hypothetical protein
MNLFARFRRRRRGGGARGRTDPHARPRLEPLEDRTLLATRLIVPLAQAVDMVNTFHDLNSAVMATTTVAGDIIQVEPGSAPGGAPVTKALTIRGDQNNGPASLPAVGALTLAVSNTTVQNLNVASITINNGVTGAQIRDNTVGNITQAFGAQVNGGDVLSGNTITGTVRLGSNAANPPGFGDQVINNAFTHSTAGTLLGIDRENVPLIQGNSFTDLANGTTGLRVADSLGAVVSGNTFTLSGATSTGILVRNRDSAASATVTDNRIDTAGLGTGIATMKFSGSSLLVNVANNDLVRDLVGLRVTGDGSTNADALGTIDAGLGVLGSLGGNDFHGYTGAGGHFAVVTANTMPTTSVVSARGNIVSTGTPGSVVQAGAGMVDVGAPLSAEAGYADRLFDNFVGRSGNPAPNGELSFWANLTAARGAKKVAPQFLSQPQAVRHLVDILYLKLMGRVADPGGEAFWVNKLLHGQSLENAIAAFLASPEFGLRANRLVPVSADADTNYVTALYIVVLGRVPSSSEVGIWLAKLPKLGRRGLAQKFTTFQEFRQLFTRALYAGPGTLPATAFVTGLPNLLHRPVTPSAAELAVWAGSKKDLLGILTGLAGSPEFFSNG